LTLTWHMPLSQLTLVLNKKTKTSQQNKNLFFLTTLIYEHNISWHWHWHDPWPDPSWHLFSTKNKQNTNWHCYVSCYFIFPVVIQGLISWSNCKTLSHGQQKQNKNKFRRMTVAHVDLRGYLYSKMLTLAQFQLTCFWQKAKASQ